MRVRRWIPKLVINSIDDAAELRSASVQQPVKTATEFRRQDFTGIARAYSREPIAVANARLQERDLAVEFDSVGREEVVRQSQRGKRPLREQALEREIVNCEQG